MEDDVSHFHIDPSHFDLIVVGTGLPESIIAAAASSVGKSVLHLDHNSFYGGHFSSFSLNDFSSFLELQLETKEDAPSLASPSRDGGTNYVDVDLKSLCLYSDIEISSNGSYEDMGSSGKFSLDLSGPRVLFCADLAVNILLKSGANHHVEFKGIDASFIYGDNGKLSTVPDSRSAIFKDRSLGLLEKNKLMRFFKLVQEHFGFSDTPQDLISSEDLESPFIDFLTKQQLSSHIKSIILYAIAMVNYDQVRPGHCKNLVKTKDGIECLALYHSSVGRFKNAPGALIYPMYGQGELPQAFCRAAAVKGALYILRMPVRALLLDKECRKYKGLKLASGQEVFCNQLVMGPSFTVPSQPVLSPVPDLQEISEGSTVRDVKEKVARAVCITRHSIKPGLSNLLVVFPPRSLYAEQVTSVRVLQLGGSLAVCPPGLYVWYFSALCEDAAQGKESLHAAINAVLTCSASENQEQNAFPQSESLVEEGRPTLLWSAMYIQQMKLQVLSDPINLCPMPDGNLNYRDILESTEKLFQKIYPNEELFPEEKSRENIIDRELESE